MKKGKRLSWYYIRVYDQDGKPLQTRCEQAKGPREACKLAYGTIYDNPTDTARYKEIGPRAPKYLSAGQKAMFERPDGWLPIPSVRQQLADNLPQVDNILKPKPPIQETTEEAARCAVAMDAEIREEMAKDKPERRPEPRYNVTKPKPPTDEDTALCQVCGRIWPGSKLTWRPDLTNKPGAGNICEPCCKAREIMYKDRVEAKPGAKPEPSYTLVHSKTGWQYDFHPKNGTVAVVLTCPNGITRTELPREEARYMYDRLLKQGFTKF